jgi:PIN domain nuclease of toxin-antitoxin system
VVVVDYRRAQAFNRATATSGQDHPSNPALVSEISLWEVATFFSLGRMELDVPLRE